MHMIYVDSIQHYPDCGLPYTYWCHLATEIGRTLKHRRFGTEPSFFPTREEQYT